MSEYERNDETSHSPHILRLTSDGSRSDSSLAHDHGASHCSPLSTEDVVAHSHLSYAREL